LEFEALEVEGWDCRRGRKGERGGGRRKSVLMKILTGTREDGISVCVSFRWKPLHTQTHTHPFLTHTDPKEHFPSIPIPAPSFP
jgi:hypothetical protein